MDIIQLLKIVKVNVLRPIIGTLFFSFVGNNLKKNEFKKNIKYK